MFAMALATSVGSKVQERAMTVSTFNYQATLLAATNVCDRADNIIQRKVIAMGVDIFD